MTDENSDEEGRVDLFGAPVTQIKERWGRPAFAKTKENQELVALLVAAGWSQIRIAGYLRCDEKTLRKHFSRELTDGADLIEGMALQVTLRKMRDGNSVATNRILDMIEKFAHPPPGPKPQARPAEKAEPLGKKEAAEAEAQTAHEGTEWGQLLN